MRWAVCLLLVGTACRAEPLPEIETGSKEQPVEIAETYWYSGFVNTSEAFVVGEVCEVTSNVETGPQQTWLSETCLLRVESAFGHSQHIQGIKVAKLSSEKENSPYVPVEPDWGRMRHLKKGQKVLVLLHEYEGAPCFGFEALLELTDATRTLPEILRRTGFQPSEFREEDLRVLKAASTFLHDQLAEYRSRMLQACPDQMPERRHGPTAAAAAVVLAACLLTSMGRARKRGLKPSIP